MVQCSLFIKFFYYQFKKKCWKPWRKSNYGFAAEIQLLEFWMTLPFVLQEKIEINVKLQGREVGSMPWWSALNYYFVDVFFIDAGHSGSYAGIFQMDAND